MSGPIHYRASDGANNTPVSVAEPLPVVQTGTPALPTGAATAANQTTIAGHIDTVEAKLAGPTTGTQSDVSDTASDVSILASNASRKGACFFNDSTSQLYLLLANDTASATNFSVRVAPGGYYELPVCQGGVYTGVVKGIWSADASGACRVTEFV